MRDGLDERNRQVQAMRARLDPLFEQIGRVIIGQRDLLDRLILGLLTGGHILIEGVPGLAKTLAVRTLAQGLHLSFQRIQFTPDLLPADVVGTQIYNPRTGEFTIKTELTAAKDEHLIQGTLHYQACNNSACMPPHTIPVVLDVIAR